VARANSNVDTNDSSEPAAGTFDGKGFSYSARSLVAAGLTPGAIVTRNGVSFTWPNVASG
jgi:hypothetical protein